MRRTALIKSNNPHLAGGELVNPGPGVFIIRVRPKILFIFFNYGFNLLLGPSSKTNFWQYFNCVIKDYREI